jgi:branched-chain amino acid transport system permease protein
VTTEPARTAPPPVSPAARATSLLSSQRLPALGFVVLILVLPLIPPFDRQDFMRYLIVAAFMAAQAVAFDFTSGYINIVNFGFAAFVGLGGYTSALLALNFGLSPWIGIFVGGLAAGLLGFLTGALTLRLSGIYAAVMAWFVGLALMGLVRNAVDITRGSLGLNVPSLFSSSDNLPYYYVIVAMLLTTLAVLLLVTRSHIGLAFRAIGQNVQAARASGINPTRYRVINFTLSCAFAGWLGGFYAHFYGILTPDVMATSHTVEVLVIAYIGGRGSLWGGAVVAFPLVIGIELLRTQLASLPGLHLVFYGILLILVMIYRPGGVAAFLRGLDARLRRGRTEAHTGK